ncbi:OLC1v1002510C2 [Oldenlandia corymbosa var. corymbosa]|uniref:Kinetochore protein NDC80 n=1 Tax=Oldenlandia corymbosa var. corymbosa TaxID=529605 RepID=A0AAV1D7S3_OLDCO|nr:OLC1v1002510C2 [Oldenlandia corymbosa var. corymbosa]
MRNAGRRRANDSLAPERRPPPPTPTSVAGTPGDPWHFLSTGRDSDASFASTRPSSSSIGINPRSSMVPITDKSYQVSAIRTINAYLSSHSFPVTLKPPLPSAKDIMETLKFILSRLGFTASKIEDDLQIVLKTLNSPVKLNKSALRAPGTPHSWPSLLAVIHWLVQVNLHDDHLLSVKQTRSNFEHNDMFQYSCDSYLFYIRGDDASVEALDDENMKKLISAKEEVAEVLKNLEETVKDSEKKLEGFKTGPSEREKLEKEKSLLEEDVKKFHDMIEQLDGHMVSVEKLLDEKEKELETKILESKKVKEENEELKRRIEEQGINAYDAERMRKELMAVERDIAETEDARNGWEEKTWDLDSQIGHKLQELEGQIIECNQAMRRLKLGNEYQYHLNPKGSTPSEVLSLDYKSTIKPALASFEDNIKKGSMHKLEELISLRQQSAENEAKIEAKRNKTAALISHIVEVEVRLNTVKKESQDYTARCASEARKLLEEVEAEARNLEIVEKEATEMIKASKLKLREVMKHTDEEIQLCARELFMLIDSVSKNKEYMKSKIVDMKKDLLETTGAIADVHRGSFSATLGHVSAGSH